MSRALHTGAISGSVNGPVLDLKVSDLTEGAVVRHQHGARVQGVGGDEQVKRSEIAQVAGA
jgi:hypothetical protein